MPMRWPDRPTYRYQVAYQRRRRTALLHSLSAADHSLLRPSTIEVPPTGSRQRRFPQADNLVAEALTKGAEEKQTTAPRCFVISFPRAKPSWSASLDALPQDEPGSGTDDSINPSNPDDRYTLYRQ